MPSAQLTVMFCDLVGSTALSARLDPEDLREIIAAYHRAVAEIIAGFDGFVSRYTGDGVLVYFGYPQAHEDDAERAVRAGLGAIDAVSRLDVKSVKLQTRVGIASGLVGDLIGAGAIGRRGDTKPRRPFASPRRAGRGRHRRRHAPARR
jgi:class 3 adenylate cyclase